MNTITLEAIVAGANIISQTYDELLIVKTTNARLVSENADLREVAQSVMKSLTEAENGLTREQCYNVARFLAATLKQGAA